MYLYGEYAVPLPLPCGAGADDVAHDDFWRSCIRDDASFLSDHEVHVVNKKAMIETITQTGELTGKPTKDTMGRAVFTGHSLRVTGARRPGSLGISTATIMLLARWSSNVIFHCLADAPLRSLTSEYRQRRALGVTGASRDIRDLSTKMERLTRQFAEQEDVLLKLQRRVDVSKMSVGPTLIRSDVSGVVLISGHRISWTDDFSQSRWRNARGWAFGESRHTRVFYQIRDIGPVTKRCARCFSNLGHNQVALSLSSSSSSSQSGRDQGLGESLAWLRPSLWSAASPPFLSSLISR